MMEESPEHNRFPDVGIVINLSPYEDKNPHMVPNVTEFPKAKLLKYAAEFAEMAKTTTLGLVTRCLKTSRLTQHWNNIFYQSTNHVQSAHG